MCQHPEQTVFADHIVLVLILGRLFLALIAGVLDPLAHDFALFIILHHVFCRVVV